MMCAIIWRMVGMHFVADDLLQEASVQAYLSLDALRDPARFHVWLYGITRNVCLMFLRVQRVRSISLEFLMDIGGEPVAQTTDPQEAAERLELRQTIMRCLDQLSPALREAVMLFYYDGFTLEETSALLAVSSNTIKGRLHRARQQIRDLLIAVEIVAGCAAARLRTGA
jgi:RNA polymerase sigma-70 factor (ECF subfamily)